VNVRWRPAEALVVDDSLRTGLADAGGVPLIGRPNEHDQLRIAGAGDLAWGRLYEGHVNALQLIARLGTERQRLRAEHDVAQDGSSAFGTRRRRRRARDGGRFPRVTLAGRKTFASGAGRVCASDHQHRPARGAVAIGRRSDGSRQDTIDRSFWQPYGMEASESFAVDFTRRARAERRVARQPGDYQRDPWFTAGASRFVAVQTGGMEQLVAGFGAFLRRREQHEDAIQLTRFGECVVAARTALLWTNSCVDAWMRYDLTPTEVAERNCCLRRTLPAARWSAAHSIFANASSAASDARGLLETEPFARRLRDLRMYLRQPARSMPTLLRVARSSMTPRAIT